MQSITYYHVLSAFVENASWTFMTEYTTEIAWGKYLKTLRSLVSKTLKPIAFHRPLTPKSFLRSRDTKIYGLEELDLAPLQKPSQSKNLYSTIYHTNRSYGTNLCKLKLLYIHANGL
ncbi:unnamed protein product, partial [Dicrocoelium dendriticum]